MQWSNLFEYNSGGYLVHLPRPLEYFTSKRIWRSWNSKWVGKKAGTLSKKNGVRVHLKRGFVPVQNIVWEMHNGEIPEGKIVDHIDHDNTNNRLENLRLVDTAENNKNKSTPKSNTSSVAGVSFHKSKNKWQVHIGVKGKKVFLGYFRDFDEAVRVRREALVTHGFHENHCD